jgi:RHS repeat-associated protein
MSVVRKAMMKAALISLAVCMGFCLAGLEFASPVAFAEGSSALGGTGGSPLENPLVVPEGLPLLGEQSVQEIEEARRASPEAVIARQESQTKYEGLSAGEASKLAGEVFPGMVDHPAGGLPQLPEGEHITNIIGANAAQVSSAQGGKAVLESVEPIAAESSSGKWAPVNLSVSEVSGGFQLANPVVGLSIPKQLQEGVSLAGLGVSLTPVDASGAAVGGSEGRLDGSVVFYGGVDVGSDVDEIVKPETDGFSEDAILRSSVSPKSLVYRVGLPEGASLVKANDGLGVVDVVDEGSVIARLSVPFAQDATGASVPVSVGMEGNLLTVNLDMEAGAYEYPILVDPVMTMEDKAFDKQGGYTTNWHFHSEGERKAFSAGEATGGEGEAWVMKVGLHSASEWGALEYTTQGESYIKEFGLKKGTAKKLTETHVEALMEIVSSKGGLESKTALSGEGVFGEQKAIVTGSANNSAEFLLTSTNAGSEVGAQLELNGSWVIVAQEKDPEVSIDTSHEYVDGGRRNVFYGSGGWIGPNSGGFEFHAKDGGVGISEYVVTIEQGEKIWKETHSLLRINGECSGWQCPPEVNKGFAYNGEMPNGEDTLNVTVYDGVGGKAKTTQTLKVDNEPPHSITLSGLPSNHEISDGQHPLLKASAEDGVEGKPAPGLASIMLEVDGQAVGGTQGSCSGSCTGHAEWTLNGENYAAGEHTLTVVATDNAGNVETTTSHVTIHHAGGVAVGPGSVNPVTGELSMAASDVSLSVPGGALTVSRSYRSRHLAQGTEGPLGPQWNLNLSAQQSLSRVTGGMVLTSESGSQVVFESKGGGEFTSPTGDAGLTLLEKPVEGKTVFILSDDGSVTTFELPVGSSGSVWMPSNTEGPNGTSKTLYKFKLENSVIEPTEELAPVPANVECGKEISELKEGCRALKFEYATETKAKGDKASEWNEYIRHLSRIKYIAWNASKTKTETVVAEYAYDAKGRLRAEWNPEVTPSPLKTTYGYDSEGHVTALSTAGHEPELLEQGTIPGDSSPGRLLAVAVPSAATALGTGEAPAIKEVPTLSSTKPAVGTKISVNLTSEKTPGTWTGAPLAFIYQWEDCNSEGKECSPIQGAVNQAYYPVAGDQGHELVAKAIALNATGAVAASSEATATVTSGTETTPLPEPPVVGSDAVTTLEYQVRVSGSGAPYEMSSTETAKWGQTDDPSEAMAVFPPDKVMGWPAKEYKRDTVYYLDGKDRAVNTALPTGGTTVTTGAISVTEYNLYNDVTRTLSPDNRLQAITEGCKVNGECKVATESTYEEKGAEPGTEILSTRGPQHTVELAVGKEGKVNEEVQAREHTSYSYNEGAPSEGGPYDLVTKTIEGAETPSKEEFDKRTTEMSYGGQSGLGWKLRKPTSVITDPSGLDLVHTTEYNSSTGSATETKMPAASGKDADVPPTYAAQFGSSGTGAGQFTGPTAATVDASGNIWVVDKEDNRIEKFNASGTFLLAVGWGVKDGKSEAETCTVSCQAGIAGSGNGQFKLPSGIVVSQSTGDVYVTDGGNGRIEVFSSSGAFLKAFGSSGSGAEQLSSPAQSAIDASGNLWVVDYGNSRIMEFSAEGVFKLGVGWGVKDGKSEAETCTTTCQAGVAGSGNGQFFTPQSVAISGGNVYVVDRGNNRVEEFSSAGSYIRQFGSKGTGSGQFSVPFSIATIPSSEDLFVTDKENNRVEEFTPSGGFMSTFGEAGTGNGQLSGAKGIAVSGSSNVYVVDSGNNRVEEWIPTITGNEGAHDTKTIFYTAAANSEYSACGEQFAMASLPCETIPAAQPGTSGLPELPTTKYTYNIFSEPETTKETVGSTTRTKTDTYDATGRLTTSALSSSVGEKIPTVTDEYNKETGAPEKQCQNEGKPCTEGTPKTITGIYNKLGELESYTDAAEKENKTTYEYSIDGLVKKVKGEKGTETYTYSETTGLPESLLNEYGTSKLTFTSAYDVEGNMLTEGYPNGMTAKYTYNTVGKPTGLEYKKETHCTEEEKEKCKWFTDSVIPSIHGQWIEQTSTLSHQTYAYDNAGRLTEVQNTPTASKNCTVRLYAYDEDSNRTTLMTREPGKEGKCATEGGQGQGYTYDTADRLTEPGITYNTFGDITALPTQNSEDPELTSTYYTDNQVQSQKQNEQTISYTLDPAGRTLEADATGKPISANILSHYTGPSNTPTWTINTSTKAWKRNITGINGSLLAIQAEGANPVLQLTNLHGDIIATASISETATELASKADTSEFGVPTISNPEKYAWLGAMGLPTELPSGVIAMGARSYVPQLGRFLQPDPIPSGSANAYSYTFGDPVNTTDPTGDYVEGAYLNAFNDNQNKEAVEREEAREAAARAAAEQAAREAAAAAAAAAGPQYAGDEEEWEEWWEEEGEYEYASWQHGGKPGNEEAHVEPAILLQPLSGEEAGKGDEAATLGSAAPLCKAGAEGPCARPARGGEGTCKSCGRRHHGGGGHHSGGGHSGGESAAEKCAKGALAGGVGGAAGGAAGGAVAGGAGAGPGALAGGIAGAVGGCITGVLG